MVNIMSWNFKRSILTLTLVSLSAHANSASFTTTTVKIQNAGKEAITRTSGTLGYPTVIPPGETREVSFTAQWDNATSTEVTYRTASGNICLFTGGHTVQPGFWAKLTQSGKSLGTDNTYCGAQSFPTKFSAPYDYSLVFYMGTF